MPNHNPRTSQQPSFGPPPPRQQPSTKAELVKAILEQQANRVVDRPWSKTQLNKLNMNDLKDQWEALLRLQRKPKQPPVVAAPVVPQPPSGRWVQKQPMQPPVVAAPVVPQPPSGRWVQKQPMQPQGGWVAAAPQQPSQPKPCKFGLGCRNLANGTCTWWHSDVDLAAAQQQQQPQPPAEASDMSVDELEAKAATLEKAKAKAVAKEDFDKASSLKAELKKVSRQLQEAKAAKAKAAKAKAAQAKAAQAKAAQAQVDDGTGTVGDHNADIDHLTEILETVCFGYSKVEWDAVNKVYQATGDRRDEALAALKDLVNSREAKLAKYDYLKARFAESEAMVKKLRDALDAQEAIMQAANADWSAGAPVNDDDDVDSSQLTVDAVNVTDADDVVNDTSASADDVVNDTSASADDDV